MTAELGARASGTSSAVAATPVAVDVLSTPKTNTNWSGVAVSSSRWFNARRQSTGAQNAELTYDVGLGAGTWTLDLFHFTGTTIGIYTITLDGASLTSLGGSADTIDGYSISSTPTLSPITGIVIGTGGVKTLRVVMATKNGSSSSYVGDVSRIVFNRTAAP